MRRMALIHVPSVLSDPLRFYGLSGKESEFPILVNEKEKYTDKLTHLAITLNLAIVAEELYWAFRLAFADNRFLNWEVGFRFLDFCA